MNQKLALIFYEIADILEMQNVQWKPQAYRKAAKAIESLSDDVKDIYEKGGVKALEDIPGVGEAIGKKIIEYIQTGKVKHLGELKKTIPEGVVEMMKVPGLGAKRALKLHNKLGINSIKELEKAVREHKVAGIESFKEKTEENILEGIGFMEKRKVRILLGRALPVAKEIVNELSKLKVVKKAIVGGSLRRMEETIGDVDILVAANSYNEVVNFFTRMPNVKKILAKGDTKSSIITNDDMQVDLRIVKENSFGSALQYFTGNKEHNIHVRDIAIRKGMKLSEYGLFKGDKQIAGRTEKEVYNKLGMQYIEPELRTETGEIEAALRNKLPKIIEYNEILGDLHSHTIFSDGEHTIKEMALAAKKYGLKYLAITDHGGDMHEHVANKDIEKYLKEIEKVNKNIEGIELLKGVEADIGPDGKLSVKDDLLKEMDVVIAAVHSEYHFDEKKQTARILKALNNNYVNILGHPTSRLLQERAPMRLNLEKVFEAAKERNIALEINSAVHKLDLDSANIRKAVKNGCKMVISTDAHDKVQFHHLEMGIGQARRGWATKKDILNTLKLNELKKAIKR